MEQLNQKVNQRLNPVQRPDDGQTPAWTSSIERTDFFFEKNVQK